MESLIINRDSNNDRYQRFKVDVENTKKFQEKIDKIFKREFESCFKDILFLSKNDFFLFINNEVEMKLKEMYTSKIFSDYDLSDYLNNSYSKIEDEYNNHYEILKKAWDEYKNLKNKNKITNQDYLTTYRKHCCDSDNFASHNCQIEQTKFYIVKINNIIKYVICIKCESAYLSSSILCHCFSCNNDYYSSILEKDENPNLLIATWKKYHCPRIINQKMKCIKCSYDFYLNLKTKQLNCLNKKCNFIINQKEILWTCVICNKDFKSEAIVYNPIEYIHAKSALTYSLLIKKKAHPRIVPCCFLNVLTATFRHKEDCDGILFEGEFDNKVIILCEKCKALNLYDRFIWTCPNCGKRFKDGKKLLLSKSSRNSILKKYDSSTFYFNSSERKKHFKNIKTSLFDIIKARKFGIKIETDIIMKEARKTLNNFNTINFDNNLHSSLHFGQNGFKKRNYTDGEIIFNISNIDKSRISLNLNKITKENKIKLEKDKKDINYKIMKEKEKNERKKKEKEERERKEKEEKERKEKEERERKEKEERERKEKEERERKEKEERERKEKEEKERKEKEEKEKEKEEKYNEAILRTRKNMFDELIRRSSKIMPNLYQLFPIKEENGRKQRRSIKEDYELLLSSSGDEFLSVDSDNQTGQILSNNESENNGHFIFENNIVIKKINKILSETKIPKFNIDDYEIESTLGEGSYGVIYKVKNIHNGKIYAMKKMIANDVEQIEKAHKEYEIVSICNHPNVMKIYSMNIKTLDITTYCLYILMEIAICDWDKEIKKHLNEGHYYKENELILILKQLVRALYFMQTEVKITHRDIKPQNILCFPKHIYKIADFGEAKAVRLNRGKMNTVKGTQLYMSPALYDGLKQDLDDVSHDPFKSDVFSLGFCFTYAAFLNFNIIYEVREITDMKKLEQVLRKHFKDKYSEKFITILCKMLEIDERKRFDFLSIEKYIEDNYPNDIVF